MALVNSRVVSLLRSYYGSCVRRISLAFLCLMLVACGGNKTKPDDIGKPQKLQDFERRVKLQAQWSRDLGKGQGKDDDRLTLGVSPEGVCAASIEGKLACYDHSGKKQWRAKVGSRLSGGIGVSSQHAMVVDSDGRLLVYRRDDGELLWEKSIGTQILAAPQSDGEFVVVQTSDGRVIAFSAGDGSKQWEYSVDEPRLTLKGTATPVIDRGVVYTGFANGKLMGLDIRNGNILFDNAVAIASGTAEIERIVDLDASPTISNEAIYAASYNGNLFAFDRRTGRPMWRYETSSYRELALGLDKVYLVDDSGQLFALSDDDGSERWLQSDLRYRKLSAPVVYAGYLLVADYKGYLHVLSQVDGTIVGRRRADNAGVRVPMRAYGDNLYVYSNKGKLVAYRLQTLAN